MLPVQPRVLNRILFIRTDRLGETLLNLPAIAALRTGLPRASLTLLVHPDLQALMQGMSGVDEVLAMPTNPGPWWRRAIRLARQLRPKRFDAVMVSNPKKELHVAVWLAGIPCRVGYGRKWGVLLTHRLTDGKALGRRHEVEYNLELVRALGVPAAPAAFRLTPSARDQQDAAQLLASHGVAETDPFIAVHPWSSNPGKEWPGERYRALVRSIAQRGGPRVVLIGGLEEQSRVPAILAAGGSAASLVGRLTLTQLAAVLRRAALLLSNDSGPVHLAASVGTPTVVLFGTRDPAAGPQRWGPWGEGHAVIWRPTMDAISVDEVLAAVEARLAARA